MVNNRKFNILTHAEEVEALRLLVETQKQLIEDQRLLIIQLTALNTPKNQNDEKYTVKSPPVFG